MSDISDLKSADRVEIFKHLAVNESDGVNVQILESIACDNFHTFLEFCDTVFDNKDRIDNISCSIDSDNKLKFDIEYKQE